MDRLPPPHVRDHVCSDKDMVQPESRVGEDFADGNGFDRWEETAGRAKRATQNEIMAIPPFLRKLSQFLSEPNNRSIIRWSDKGDTFEISDKDEFAEKLLPQLFKHKNFASFVRQLNMYGFQKRGCFGASPLRANELQRRTPIEYHHPYFRRGRPDLLLLIRRPKFGPSRKAKEKVRVMNDASRNQYQSIASAVPSIATGSVRPLPKASSIRAAKQELDEVRGQQARALIDIDELERHNANLRTQALVFQNQHDSHEKSINAILVVLAHILSRCQDSVSDKALEDPTPSMQIDQHGSCATKDSISGPSDLLSLQLSSTPCHERQETPWDLITSTSPQPPDPAVGQPCLATHTSQLSQSTGNDVGLVFPNVLSGISGKDVKQDAPEGIATKATCMSETSYPDRESIGTKGRHSRELLHTSGQIATAPVAPAISPTLGQKITGDRAVEVEPFALTQVTEQTATAPSSQNIQSSTELSHHEDPPDPVESPQIHDEQTHDPCELDDLFGSLTPSGSMDEFVGAGRACPANADLETMISDSARGMCAN